MNTTRWAGVVVALCISVAGVASGQVRVFDLSADFSLTGNPNGPWSYNVGDSPIPYPGEAGCCAGWTPHPLFDGSILIALSDPCWNVYHDWLAGDVTVHPYAWMLGGQTIFSNITWTAPRAGVIDLSGSAWNAGFYDGRDSAWWLELNGDVIAGRSTVFDLYRTDTGASFKNNLLPGKSLSGLAIAEGDVLAFVTQATTDFGHFMGVKLSVRLGCESGCKADYNCDGFVDGIDYDRFNNDFESPDPWQQANADYNGDGFVDGIDYDLFNNDFEAGC